MLSVATLKRIKARMQPEEFQGRFSVSRETLDKLKAYERLLKKWQGAINLVSPGTLDNVWERHLADSAQILELIPEKSIVADLGSGAGFPGLVLSIVRSNLAINLIESDSRKCEFLKAVSRETGAGASVHNARIENVLESISPSVITTRAYASLLEIFSVCESVALKNPELMFVLLKGKSVDDEILEAHKSYNFSFESIESTTERGAKMLVVRGLKKL